MASPQSAAEFSVVTDHIVSMRSRLDNGFRVPIKQIYWRIVVEPSIRTYKPKHFEIPMDMPSCSLSVTSTRQESPNKQWQRTGIGRHVRGHPLRAETR